MPHECTNCGRTFPDGSKEMLSGCPDCGGNKFQFVPSGSLSGGGTVTDTERDGASGSGSPSSTGPDSSMAAAESSPGAVSDAGPGRAPPETGGDAGAGTEVDPQPDTGETEPDSVAGRAAETVREWMSGDDSDEESAPEEPIDGAAAAPDEGRDRLEASDRQWPESGRDSSPSPGTGRGSANSSTTTSEADRATGRDADTDEATDADGFTEWPDTARRPEDRSSADPAESGEARGSAPNRSSSASSSSSSSSSAGTETSSPSGPAAGDDETDYTTAKLAESENDAQADARSEVVHRDALPSNVDADGDREYYAHDPGQGAEPETDTGSAPRSDDGATAGSAGPDRSEGDRPPSDGRVVSEPSDEEPSIEDLREELNQQFESIKIVRPGQYELNLMELYNREEYIISLQEDGRYVIDVPDSWREAEE
ncbi:hypothetical protein CHINAEXTREME_04585 [Halobiforma lacisalsi AJ5]|uniref:Origin-associated protein OapC n=1 Tax=Natronobacterium lacisalsi AJ5 TaxID=358396 RepID=M0LLG6_NATLA|nr:Zn-ribbon containing protein [Halobiforma lacisalsi]APW97089.1 hypothetical protein CHINAEXTREME_04585 [Halobiforma lacisalsi AJ5]EMA34422.1 hypothetical protein C445_07847 [Halobiforma lacisalsi AJ5]